MATVSAALVLAVAMGFGRFAFTAIYPLMVRDHVLSVTAGSLAASANYAGYLAGALLASRVPETRAAQLCRLALAGTVVAMLALAIPMPPSAIIAIRFVAGVLSAFSMVSASVWLFGVMGSSRGAPLLFAGVGAGITVSAELIARGNVAGLSSGGMWILLAVAAALPMVLAWPVLGRFLPSPVTAPGSGHGEVSGLPQPWMLTMAYGLAGFGYIITATYLPLFVRDAFGSVDPVHVWAVFGLCAAPSCYLWHVVQKQVGTKRALAFNLMVRAFGVILPVLLPSRAGYLGSALLVGGTFMGTVTIVMSAAKHLAPRVRHNLVAVLTAAYGIGQIAGPIAASVLVRPGHAFAAPLAAATASLVAATVVSVL